MFATASSLVIIACLFNAVSILYIQNTVDRTIQLKLADKQRISQRPRRSCGLQPAPIDAEVIGKVSRLSWQTYL